MKKNQVLFLDDERNVLNSIERLFMDEAYGVAVADNWQEALRIMASGEIKVVLSDQRMPDITGTEFLSMVKGKYPDTVRILFTAYADLLAAEEAINRGEVYRYVNKPWHPDELKATVAGAISHYDLVFENRRLLEDLKIKNDELNLANCKLRMLYDVQKEFSSTVSHELRTPLASIKAAIDIVISGTAGEVSDDQRKFLGKAKDNVDRLNRLINDILDLAHLESGKTSIHKKPGDLNKTITTVFENQEAVALNKGLFLKMQLDPLMPVLAFDADKLIQVMTNLVGNAIKFTDQGGITITSTFNAQDNTVLVQVQDTGCGIKDEDIPKLFEKFQQLGETHHKYAGTGLGLAICKEIIRQHGGKIGVKSAPGQGSCFYFTLPSKERSA